MLVIYGSGNCPACDVAKKVATESGVEFIYHDISQDPQQRDYIIQKGFRTVPQVFVGGEHIGGLQDLSKFVEKETN